MRTSLIGLIDGVAESTACITKIFAGYISDKMRQRKWLAVLGYGLSTIAKPFYYLAITWGTILGIRFSDRIGKGIRTALRDALLAGSTELEKRSTAYGLYAVAVGLIALPTPAIAGVLWQGVGSWSDFGAPAPFSFGAGMSLLAGLLFWKFIK